MRRSKSSFSELTTKLKENLNGTLEGGFIVLSAASNAVILGGVDSNNCNGENCVAGCGGQNSVEACGTPLNNIPGCGANQRC